MTCSASLSPPSLANPVRDHAGKLRRSFRGEEHDGRHLRGGAAGLRDQAQGELARRSKYLVTGDIEQEEYLVWSILE